MDNSYFDALVEGLAHGGDCPNTISSDPMRQALSTQCSGLYTCVGNCQETFEQRCSCWKRFAKLYATDVDFRKNWVSGYAK